LIARIIALLLGGLLVAATASAEDVRTGGPCSPIIEKNPGEVTVNYLGNCLVLDLGGWTAIADTLAAYGIRPGQEAPPARAPIFKKHFDLPWVRMTYEDLQQMLHQIQQRLLEYADVTSVLGSTESLTVSDERSEGGRVSVFRLNEADLKTIVTEPSQGFEYTFESHQGRIREITINYFRETDGEGTGWSPYLLIAADDKASVVDAHDIVLKALKPYESGIYSVMAFIHNSIFVLIVFVFVGVFSLVGLLFCMLPKPNGVFFPAYFTFTIGWLVWTFHTASTLRIVSPQLDGWYTAALWAMPPVAGILAILFLVIFPMAVLD
jgi:hypothetical protein